MKKNVAHTVAFIGVMAALTFVVLTLETYVFIYFIKPSPAFFSIPLFIALSMFGDWRHSFIGGTVFGLCSFILSFIVGYTAFYNPVISVLPRVMAGVAGFWIAKGITSLLRGKAKLIGYGIAAGLTVIIHTTLVIAALILFKQPATWKVILTLNFGVEFGCAIILVPVFVQVMRRVMKKTLIKKPKCQPIVAAKEDTLNDSDH